jgi:putative ABC transport system permease protein
VLLVVGIFGVLSYSIVQLAREIGVRMALGAAPHQIARDVLGRSVRWAVVGIMLGLALTMASHRLVQSRVWGLATLDVQLLATVAGLVVLVALVTAWIPARRAMRVDPVEVLRAE